MSTSEQQGPQVPPLTSEQIGEILRTCYPGMSETILTPEEAKARAEMVHADMLKVGFPLLFDTYWPVPAPGNKTIRVPSYKLLGAIYGPEADPYGDNNKDASGPLLSCGEFVRLSKVCKLARQLLTTEKWPARFTGRLRDPKSHLAVLEEILWLGRWRAPKSIEMAYKQNHSSQKDIDWRFDCCGQMINLEVKSRPRDWIGLTDGSHFSRNFDSYFRDVEDKFGPQQNDELNVVGITTWTPPDRGLRECTQRFLQSHSEIDAVIFWSLHDPNGERPEIQSRRPSLIKLFLKEADREDNLFIAPIRHLWRKSEERRALRPNEALQAISKIVRKPPA